MLTAASASGVEKVINGWNFTPNTMGSAGYSGDFLTRGAIQCLAGVISNDPEEAVYPLTQVDVDGDRLTGAQKYTKILCSRQPAEGRCVLVAHPLRRQTQPGGESDQSLRDQQQQRRLQAGRGR